MFWPLLGQDSLSGSELCGRKLSLMLKTPATWCDWSLGLGLTAYAVSITLLSRSTVL